MGKIGDWFTYLGAESRKIGHRDIVSVDALRNLHEIHETQLEEMKKEYELIISDLRKQIEKINDALGSEMSTCQWYISEWKKSQDNFRKKMALMLAQSGKYAYNDIPFYTDEIIKELQRTEPVVPIKNIFKKETE